MAPSAEQVWLDRVIAAGMRVYDATGEMHDGTKPADRDAAKERVDRDGGGNLRAIIPVRPTHAEHVLHVTTLDGSVTHLYPIIRWGTQDESDWYGQMIKNCKADLLVCEEKAEMLDLTARIRELQRDQLQLYIPELPPNLLTRIDPTQYSIIWTALHRMELDGQQVVEAAQKKMLESYPEVLSRLERAT